MMIKNIKKRANRILAAFIAALMCMTVFTAIPATAEIGTSVFDYNDYVVEYAVVNEWGNSQNIEIKLINTSSEPIYNWALKYDAGGGISGLWNTKLIKKSYTGD